MQPLRTRDFRLIVASVALSSMGDELALIALTIKVFDLRHSGFAVSALLLSGLLPLVLLAPVAGLLVDRTEKVSTLVVTSLAQAALAFALAATANFPSILVLSFLLGMGVAIAQPALFAAIPHVVGESETTRANAWTEAAKYAGWVLGPVLAGVLSQTVGTGAALAVDGASFLAIAGGGLALSVRSPASSVGKRSKGEARKGFRFLVSDRVLAVTVGVLATTILFAAIDNVSEVFFAKNVLDAGSWGYGALAGAWLAGMFVAATTLAGRVKDDRLAQAVMVGSLAVGVGVGLAAAFALTIPAIGLFFLGGIGNGIENVAIRSLIHRRTPEELRARVYAAYFGLAMATQVGATALGGLFVVTIGSRSALLVSGVGGAVCAIVGLVLISRWADVVRIPEAQTAAGDQRRIEARTISGTEL